MGCELAGHLRETAIVSDPLGITWVPIGLQPITALEEIGWVPKGRYRIMAPYLGARGTLAHQMMRATAGVQLNFDYSDETDAVDKFRTAMGIGSILTAACANSPISAGKPNGFMSRRAHIWSDTDPDRCGLLDLAFRNDLSFRHYVDYALDVPVIFVQREGRWVSLEGVPFRRFMSEGWEGLQATYADWVLHLTTIFTEVRLKTYVEVRGMDSIPPALTLAMAALWKGILYDPGARRRAWDLVAKVPFPARVEFHGQVGVHGPQARLDGVSALDLARELVGHARDGLRRLEGAAKGREGEEEKLLTPLVDSLDDEGGCPAVRLQHAWLESGSGGPRELVRAAARDTEAFLLGAGQDRP
jgi:glutamate--cysteine ligase